MPTFTCNGGETVNFELEQRDTGVALFGVYKGERAHVLTLKHDLGGISRSTLPADWPLPRTNKKGLFPTYREMKAGDAA